MQTPSAELKSRIEEYVSLHSGKAYTPIPHPAFSAVPYRNGPERFDLIAPHLEFRNGTLLDIGSKWGYMAHRFEELGYKVTAVERSRKNVYFMKEIRNLCNKQFEIIQDSVFNLKNPAYDVAVALNIFHHFMKTKEHFEQLDAFLKRLKCRCMIYQAHLPDASQMDRAYQNMTPEEATKFISERLSLPRIIEIGSDTKGRRIFKIAE